MTNFFTKHPHQMGESYWQHFICATKFGIKMIFAGTACLIHAIFPFLFQKTGSNMLFGMMNDYIKRTPNVEERIVVLSHIVKKKYKRCDS